MTRLPASLLEAASLTVQAPFSNTPVPEVEVPFRVMAPDAVTFPHPVSPGLTAEVPTRLRVDATRPLFLWTRVTSFVQPSP